MSPTALTRAAASARPAAPVRIVHLGLGNFFRAHQAWFTDRAPDAAEWGIAAFGGRSRGLADDLGAQDGLYTLTTRSPERDQVDVVASISRVHGADDHQDWLDHLASPDVCVVTMTVTEAGYCRAADGSLDLDDPQVHADLQALRRDPVAPVCTAPARLLAGITARHRAGAGPITIVPCDNLARNGAVLGGLLDELAAAVGPGGAAWPSAEVSVATSMVDRITPRTSAEDRDRVARSTGWVDLAPVATEPFAEWVLTDEFPGGRPAWDGAGARFAADVVPFEHRKLWLLNGGHSLLAYLGSARGHVTVADAVADETCRAWLERWWSEAGPHLAQPSAVVSAYTAALLERFANPRIDHRLAQIAADGSQKLPIRVLPTLRAEREAGRLPEGAAGVLAAWVAHLRGSGAPVVDPLGETLVPLASGPSSDAVRRVLAVLDPEVAEDADLVGLVSSLLAGIEATGAP